MMRTLIAALTIMLAAAPALAQDISGGWSFRTDIEEKGCTIEGNMSIQPDTETGNLICTFTSRETCVNDPEGDEGILIDQSCRIYEQGDYYLFSSRVERSLSDAYDARFYLPDHFTVKPDGPDRMTGQWYDRNYRDQVEFWRNRNTNIS